MSEIDVNKAFGPDQGQQDLEQYLESRPYQDSNGGTHSPDGQFVNADRYFDEQYRIADEQHHMVNESASKPYEEYSADELEQALADAEQRQDKTSAKNIAEAQKENAERLKESRERPIREMSPVQLAKQLARAEHAQDEDATEFIGDVLLEKLASKEEILASNAPVNEADTAEDRKAHQDRVREDRNAHSDIMWNSVMKLKEKERKNLERLDEMRSYEEHIEDWLPENVDGHVVVTLEDQSPKKPEDIVPPAPLEDNLSDGFDNVSPTSSDMLEDRNTPEKFKPVLHVGEASKAAKGEDTMINRSDLRLFGVFDGLGGHGNGEKGSKSGAEGIEGYYEAHTSPVVSIDEAIERAREAVLTARYNVDKSSEGGYTTAVFAKIEQIDGAPYLVWGNIGDSRLFLQSGDRHNDIQAISTDQSAGNTVFNVLNPGEEKPRSYSDEFGVKPLMAGDRIMLCSDGITGDWEEQFLSDDEMMQGFSSDSPQEAADKFLELSKKYDDKSVLVIDIADEADETQAPLVPPAPPESSDQPTPPLPNTSSLHPDSPSDLPPVPLTPLGSPDAHPSVLHPLSVPSGREDVSYDISDLPPLSAPTPEDVRDYDWPQPDAPAGGEQGNDSNLPPLTVKKGQMRKDVHDYMVANDIDPTLSNFMKIRQNIGLNTKLTKRARGARIPLNPDVAHAWQNTEEGEEFTFTIAPEAFSRGDKDTLYHKFEGRVRQFLRNRIKE